MNYRIHQLFERIVCINLARCTDRWQAFERTIESVGTPIANIQRYTAVDGSLCPPPRWWHAGSGAWGCHQSHIRILEDALQDGVKSLLILEDDAVFADDFVTRFRKFWQDLPNDWHAILLGGQHLKPPREISENVWRVVNGNRTHAHALRGAYIAAAYQHLCNYPEHATFPRHHVDHRLGRLHESGRFAVYAPNQWLVGQSTGFSNICGHTVPLRFWNGTASHAPDKSSQNAESRVCHTRPSAMVLGLYRSGSSCVAGILHHLGVHVGSQLARPNQFNEQGFFEPIWLSRQLRAMCDEPQLAELAPRKYRVRILRQWLDEESRDLTGDIKMIAAKHPLFCLLGEELLEAWGPHTKILAVYRPLEESIASLEKAGWWMKRYRRPLMERLWNCREEFLSKHNHLRIDYQKLIINQASEIHRIIEYLGLLPSLEQIETATRFVVRR